MRYLGNNIYVNLILKVTVMTIVTGLIWWASAKMGTLMVLLSLSILTFLLILCYEELLEESWDNVFEKRQKIIDIKFHLVCLTAYYDDDDLAVKIAVLTDWANDLKPFIQYDQSLSKRLSSHEMIVRCVRFGKSELEDGLIKLANRFGKLDVLGDTIVFHLNIKEYPANNNKM